MLTLDEECNVGHPYAKCSRHNNPVLLPNGNTRGLHERPVSEKQGKVQEDVHAKHD